MQKFIVNAAASVLVLFGGLSVEAKCLKECDPEVSKPCGKTCISLELNCHQPTTRTCVGKRGKSTKKNYANPKYVEASDSKAVDTPKDDQDGAQ